MTILPEWIPIIAYFLAGIGAITIAYIVIKSNTSKETNTLNEQNIKALQTQNTIQATQLKNIENDREVLKSQISGLTGKVDTLSKIPLEKIEKHMADTNKILQAVIPLISKPKK